jgi:hypothetical protein
LLQESFPKESVRGTKVFHEKIGKGSLVVEPQGFITGNSGKPGEKRCCDEMDIVARCAG